MTFKFKRMRKEQPAPNLPSFPVISSSEEGEVLVGEVDGVQASAPEERLATALRKNRTPYMFRMTVGAPRGLPGWKELDFLVQSNGFLYAVEVDTAFTHRQKENQDVLHDAIILNDPYLRSMGTLYPQVIHVDGDSDLVDARNSYAFVKRTF